MTKKHWVSIALTCLEDSLSPVPHELNEIDWKLSLSDNKDRLTEHLIAFANHPSGGYLVFGIDDKNAHLESVTQEKCINCCKQTC